MATRTSPAHPRLVLGSSSPRRSAILAEHRYSFLVDSPGIAEIPTERESGRELVARLASEKCSVVSTAWPEMVVVAADTCVAFGGGTLGKPNDADHALAMLEATRKQQIEVYTAVSVGIYTNAALSMATEVLRSTVTFRNSSDQELEAYVASGEPFDKAGAFAIQGLGARLVADYSGCLNNIIGLPVCTMSALLAKVFEPYGGTMQCSGHRRIGLKEPRLGSLDGLP